MINQFDLSNRELLDGIQGNILKAHGRPHTANIFIHFHPSQQDDAKTWLSNLTKGDDALVKSAYSQLRSNAIWKESKKDTGLFACVHISASGFAYLLAEDANIPSLDGSFQKGMKQADLNDPDSSTWDIGLAQDNHCMLLLGHTNPAALAKAVDSILDTTKGFARVTTIENGEALRNTEGAGIEHFGYVDGVSQPLFFDDEWKTYKKDNNIHSDDDPSLVFDPRAEKELVLIPDPFVTDDPNAFGSYFVFRKLEQNVKAFKLSERALADQLGLIDEDAERAGAMIIGRFEDGTPVQVSDEAGIIHSAVLNNFDYDATNGSKCPFHGHVRKSNPRSGLPGGGMAEAKKHIMARRGIPFGTRTDDPNDGLFVNKPEGGVGLLFMSYQASIVNQFEFIQKAWVNNPDFPSNSMGIDPLIGQGDRTIPGSFATQWGQSATLTPATFDQFVHLKGGEYFFAPSLSFLKNL